MLFDGPDTHQVPLPTGAYEPYVTYDFLSPSKSKSQMASGSLPLSLQGSPLSQPPESYALQCFSMGHHTVHTPQKFPSCRRIRTRI